MSKSTVKNGRRNSALSTQKFLPFWEIRDDLLVLKNGWVRAILKTTSINFNLKSEDEQKSLILSYQWFLNTLSFPIQIYIRSKKLDIDDYVKSIELMWETQTNALLKDQTNEYAQYVKKLVEYANIMEKQFYVIVPIDWISSEKTGFLDFIKDVFWSWDDSVSDVRIRLDKFEKLKDKLKPRVASIISWLANMWLKVNQISTVEIIDLLYQIYNPEISKSEKIDDLNEQWIFGDFK